MKSSYIIAGVIAIGAFGWMASGQFPADSALTDPAADGADADALGQTVTAPPAAAPTPAETPFAVRVRDVVAQQRTRELVLYGRTEADRMVQLRVETDGRVVRRPVTKGQKVKAGALLAQLAMDDRQARLKQAEAEVRRRQVAYDAAKDLAQKNFRSKVKLVEEEAYLAAARAALRTIRVDIEHTRLRAPFTGVIETLPIEEGDYLQAGDVVAHVMDLDPLVVAAEISERDIGRVLVGGWARARLVDGRDVEGTVRFVANSSDKATRTFRVEIAIANPDGDLSEGLTTEVRLPVEQVKAHRVSPAVLTLSDQGEVGVKSVDAGGVVRFHPVVLVEDTPDGVWLGGLPDSLRLIIVGQEFVRVGQTVEAVPEAAAPAPGGGGRDMVVSDT